MSKPTDGLAEDAQRMLDTMARDCHLSPEEFVESLILVEWGHYREVRFPESVAIDDERQGAFNE